MSRKKQVMIPESLFLDVYKYFCCSDDLSNDEKQKLSTAIVEALNAKIWAGIERQSYSTRLGNRTEPNGEQTQ